MATRSLLKVLAGCRRKLLTPRASVLRCDPPCPQRTVPVRAFAAVQTKWKKRKAEPEEEVKKEKRIIDDTGRHKPYGKTAWKPVDDVYISRFYPRTLHEPAAAIDLLKSFQLLDFTPANQPVYLDLKLDMKLEKKKRIDPFVTTVQLPHHFRTDTNKVLLFTTDSVMASESLKQGVALTGGTELIQPILDDEISADVYIATPDMVPHLGPLKAKLRKKFPKTKRGTVGVNVAKMLQLFLMGHTIQVEDDCYIRTQISVLDAPKDHILANLEAVLMDVCSHRPPDAGPFIERALMASHCSEALWLRSQDLVPNPAE